MPDVKAVRVSPARAVPLMVGAPVAGEFAACCWEVGPVMVASGWLLSCRQGFPLHEGGADLDIPRGLRQVAGGE